MDDHWSSAYVRNRAELFVLSIFLVLIAWGALEVRELNLIVFKMSGSGIPIAPLQIGAFLLWAYFATTLYLKQHIDLRDAAGPVETLTKSTNLLDDATGRFAEFSRQDRIDWAAQVQTAANVGFQNTIPSLLRQEPPAVELAQIDVHQYILDYISQNLDTTTRPEDGAQALALINQFRQTVASAVQSVNEAREDMLLRSGEANIAEISTRVSQNLERIFEARLSSLRDEVLRTSESVANVSAFMTSEWPKIRGQVHKLDRIVSVYQVVFGFWLPFSASVLMAGFALFMSYDSISTWLSSVTPTLTAAAGLRH